MPRKITIDDWKDKRDYNAWKFEVDSHNAGATHARYEDAVKAIAASEEKRIGELKDTLWGAAAPFFGVNITPEELKKYFELLMNDNRNAGLVRKLKALEEERVREIETAENARLEVLRSAHEKLYEKYEKIKGMDKSEDSAASDSDSGSDEILPASDSDGNADEAFLTLDSESTTNDVSPASESEVIMEEPSESESDAAEYMTDPEDYME